ncbi:CMP-sialic acid transporter 2 [Elysia marginata]|uniref:CMP-sialic acid transporter 2 n=1 Tax=Elysia marginata TaxID=1093978 RepID=A0AAV4I191_9GAST|nr:CMP-sialic acid transporter 2 [Elysia marginata]
MFAGGLNSYTGLKAKSRSLQDIHLSVLGIFMIAIYCSVSGFSGVFTEYILKKDAMIPLAIQNCYMYIFGVILNGLLMFYQSGDMMSYQSFNRYTWAAIVSQAFNGLAMSFIMKHSSNITRLLVISSAVPVTTVLSMVVFNMRVGFEFIVVVFLVVLALCMYNSISSCKWGPSPKETCV